MTGTMKVARLYGFDDIRIEEQAIPQIGKGEILVKMKSCGICSGDVLPWYIEKKAPIVFGHEPSGIVAETGEGVKKFKVGDRVILHHHAPCMNCHLCAKKLYSMCPTWRSTNLDPGGMAEYVRVPATNVANDTRTFKASTSFEAAAMVEPVACSVSALKKMDLHADDSFVMIGLGIMGLLNIVVAKTYGLNNIIGIDCVPERLEKARELGAKHVINFQEENVGERILEITDGKKADKIIVGPGSIRAMEDAMEIAAIGSTICTFTPVENNEKWSISPSKLYFEAIKIISSYSCGPDDMAEALSIVEDEAKPFPTDALITYRYPLSEAATAFKRMSERGKTIKVMVDFPK